MAFDSAVTIFSLKYDKVDVVLAAHINAVQQELTVIETILGVGVKGDRTDLKTRLNNALDADGSILSGTSFPSPALPSQGFYRTDLDTYYIRNAANTAWVALGTSLSNVIFCYLGVAGEVVNSGVFWGSTNRVNVTGILARYLGIGLQVGGGVSTDTYYDLLSGKFTKISGINTITVRFRAWGEGSGANRDVTMRVSIGSATGNGSINSDYNAPTWGSFTIDVSSLTNGTTYDITVEMKFGTSEVACGCDAIFMIAS